MADEVDKAMEDLPSSSQATETSPLTDDNQDSLSFGFGRPVLDRPVALMAVGRKDPVYNMKHKQRGRAIIFSFENFSSSGPPRRNCAEHDANICTRAFKHLGFEVVTHWDLKKSDFIRTLEAESQVDHQNNDCLVVVLMSHGGVLSKQEFIWTYDYQVHTNVLWKNFTPDKCPSLSGKPKLFFIQACRGEDMDKGVRLKAPMGMRVETDSIPEKDYTIPLHADMLMMWASYPGMFAFKSGNNGINGSVFLHFLSRVLLEDGHSDDLTTMLLKVTREVAVIYESYVPGNYELNKNKQIPYTVSTLMRKVYFNTKI